MKLKSFFVLALVALLVANAFGYGGRKYLNFYQTYTGWYADTVCGVLDSTLADSIICVIPSPANWAADNWCLSLYIHRYLAADDSFLCSVRFLSDTTFTAHGDTVNLLTMKVNVSGVAKDMQGSSGVPIAWRTKDATADSLIKLDSTAGNFYSYVSAKDYSIAPDEFRPPYLPVWVFRLRQYVTGASIADSAFYRFTLVKMVHPR